MTEIFNKLAKDKRVVLVSEWTKEGRKERGYAAFHQFGQDYEEFTDGPANYPVAIVEWPDGNVESVPVKLIRFITK